MRRWIVEETGEVRFPKEGENFLCANNIDIAYADYNSAKYPILSVTEITDCKLDAPCFVRVGDVTYLCNIQSGINVVPSFDEWNW